MRGPGSPGWWHWGCWGHVVLCHGELWCPLAGGTGGTGVPWLVAQGTHGPLPRGALVSPGWWHWGLWRHMVPHHGGVWCPLAGGTGDTRSPATGGSGVTWLVMLGTHGPLPQGAPVSPGWWHWGCWGHVVPCHGEL